MIHLLRQQIESIKTKTSPHLLFPDRPRISFKRSQTACTCGNKLNVLKTRDKKVATLDIGEFLAHETVLHCPLCNKKYFSEELNRRVPHKCRFGFDVIVFVGEALFIHHKSDVEICQLLREKNIAISLREIAYLGKKFIVYLALCHQSCADEIKQCMQSNGGYILHLDGTCEGDSPHLMSCMDEISHIVLDNIKVPSENAQQLSPFLKGVQAVYGDPVAVMHDMSSTIIYCVESVFPGVKDFICHFHFLRDIGKDLFGFEYNNIRRYLSTFKTRSVLRKVARELQRYIAQDNDHNSSLKNYLKKDKLENAVNTLPAPVLVYLLVTWVLEAKTQSHGYGFPFDRPHLDFCHHLQEAYPKMRELKSKLSPGMPKLPLTAISRALNDPALNKSINLMQEKVIVFDELRDAMRIALPSGHQGLKDEGDQEIKTIETRVCAFRHSDNIKRLASSHIAYKKMVKQIDRYWDKLFADPIQVETKDGTLSIQPQRTNNMMETFFRDIKRDGRRKTGTSSLSKALKSMLANTPLVKNLSIPAYREIILAGKSVLAERFADIDTRSVREALKQEDENSRKYPKGMARVFKIPHLPEKLSIFTSKKVVAT